MPRTKKTENLTVNIADRKSAFNTLRLKYPDIENPYKASKVSSDNVLSTPSVSLNKLCGEDNGIRKGSIVLTYGPYGSFKSSLALQMIRQAQEKWPDKSTAFIDTEYCVDFFLAQQNMGINMEPFEDGAPRIVNSKPEAAEAVWELIGAMAATGQFSIIVLDSITAMRAKATVEEADFTLGQLGLAARVTSAALNKYEPLFPITGTILWLTSQERTLDIKTGAVGPSGGKALPFSCTHIFKLEGIDRSREEHQRKIKVFTQKMKWTKPFRLAEIPVTLGKGLDSDADLINNAIQEGLIERSASWIVIGEEKMQGMERAKEYLENNPEIKASLVLGLETQETG